VLRVSRMNMWLPLVVMGFLSLGMSGGLWAIDYHWAYINGNYGLTIDDGMLNHQQGSFHVMNGNFAPANTASVYIHGDLHVSGGSVIFNYDLIVYGDLIVEGGYVLITGTGHSLTVYGDVRVRNGAGPATITAQKGIWVYGDITTGGTTDASITAADDLIACSGTIYTRATGSANVSAKALLQASSIITVSNTGTAYVQSEDSFVGVKGAITTRSNTNDAYVKAVTGITAGSITTYSSGGHTYVETSGDKILVAGSIQTNAKSGPRDAYVKATSGLEASSIETYSAGRDAYVLLSSSGSIKVAGAIRTNSPGGNGSVGSAGGIEAASITIYAATDGDVDAATNINCGGDINTRTIGAGSANVVAQNGFLLASTITTSAKTGEAYVATTAGYIAVVGDINTYSGGNQAYVDAYTTLKAGSIGTYSYNNNAYVRGETGEIIVKGAIATRGMGGGAAEVSFVQASGDIQAGSIETYSAVSHGNVETATGSIKVSGNIRTRAGGSGLAYVHITGGAGDIDAGSITTEAVTGDAYVDNAGSGDIKVSGPIYTNCGGAGAGYIKAATGDITVGSIVTKGGSGGAHVRADGGFIRCLDAIETNAVGGAYILANSYLTAANITTSSDTGSGFVSTTNNYITVPGKIQISAQTDGLINSGSYLTAHDIVTRSVSGDAQVLAANDIVVHDISTWAQNGSVAKDARIKSTSGEIKSVGTLSTYSQAGDAYVSAQNSISAFEIYTYGAGNARVQSNTAIGSTSSRVRPAISTESTGDNALVAAANIWARSIKTLAPGGHGYVAAVSGVVSSLGDITTSAQNGAYVSGDTGVSAQKIVTESSNDTAYVRAASSGDITVMGDLITKGGTSADVSASSGAITAKGDLNTLSNTNAYILASGAITARNIKTTSSSAGTGYVSSTNGAITVLGDIETNGGSGVGGTGYVNADGNIAADNIVTSGGAETWIKSVSGAITAKGIIKTTSTLRDAYVLSANSVTAQRITTSAPSSYDKSIKSTSGTVDAEMRTDISVNIPIALQNADLALDKNTKLNTPMSIYGTCTLRGDGNELEFAWRWQ